MEWTFPFDLIICAYCKEPAHLDGWIGWYQKMFNCRFCLYVTESDDVFQHLSAAPRPGNVSWINIHGDVGEDLRLASYQDCLTRCRFDCSDMLFLQPGEYLQTAGTEMGISEIIHGWHQKDTETTILTIPSENGPRYLANPRLSRRFLANGRLVPLTGWKLAADCRELRIFSQMPQGIADTDAIAKHPIMPRSALENILQALYMQAGQTSMLDLLAWLHLYRGAPMEAGTMGEEMASTYIAALLHTRIRQGDMLIWEVELFRQELPFLPEKLHGRNLLTADCRLLERAVRAWRRQQEQGISALATAEEEKDRPKRIAMISHVMARNGAPLALLSAAKVLQHAGYEVDVFSVVPGSLQMDFEAIGIPVTIEPNLQRPLVDMPWYRDYDLVFVNTAVMASCFFKELTGPPAVWWLHESPSSLEWAGVTKEFLAPLKERNVTTVGVSEAANQALHAVAPNWPIDGTLPLGIKDEYWEEKRKAKKKHGPFIFLMVGAVEKNKGQDIFLQAIELMPAHARKQCEFWMVGGENNITPDYKQTIISLAQKYPQVRLWGAQPHERVLQIYTQADALVIASREECLPTVAIEALMMRLPCILPDNAGVAYDLEDGKNGLLFPVGDAKALADQMSWVVAHRNHAAIIGQNGRRKYHDNFTEQSFRHNLISLVENCIA